MTETRNCDSNTASRAGFTGEKSNDGASYPWISEESCDGAITSSLEFSESCGGFVLERVGHVAVVWLAAGMRSSRRDSRREVCNNRIRKDS